MKNAATPSNATPPATDNPMIEPVPSPLEPDSESESFEGCEGVGEALLFEA